MREMKFFKIVLLISLFVCLTVPALAGDLQVTVNADQTVTIVSSYEFDVHLTGLSNGEEQVGISADVPAGSQVVAEVVGDVPAGINDAIGIPMEPDGIPYGPAEDGMYHLTVN